MSYLSYTQYLNALNFPVHTKTSQYICNINKTPYSKVEHLANVTTHGIWVVPAIVAAMQLIWRSQSPSQYLVALVYGVSLALLYIVSTVFHCVFYCNRNR